VAISLVDEAAARKTLQDLRACGEEPVGDQAIIPGDGGQSFSVSSDTP
jgi:hypothetical protein